MHKYLYLALLLFVTINLKAQKVVDSAAIEEEQINAYIDSLRGAMKYQTGLVQLPGGEAELKIPAGFKFLNQSQSQFVIEKLWGNPPENAAKALGILFPEKADCFTENSYVFIVEYENMGFVKDDDAEKINYDDMLKQMQKEEVEENKERQKNGFSTIHFVGWASKPFYDKEHKVLHWAKEIHFGDDEEKANTLNYEVRILGRKGVLSLNAVCSMKELPMVKANIDQVLNMASFTNGNTYADFDPKVDKIAAWTIGGLVAGKILAKVGFFAVILKYIGVLWKFLVVGVMAVIAFIRKKILGKKDEPTYVPNKEEPVAANEEVNENTPPQLPSSEDHNETPPQA
ncbi:DUF2167 domain-containing protein [Chitinophaga sp. Hz27]|uniref:DUF2167 domain-containing protein n=1 Tax=Chitinophaga sp. Hz27 TaxID=3347169 RepID=UPI0035D83B5A